ncbi:MAG: phosphoribosylformylglycinamidine synthase [Chitinophagales bacterium]|nr:phosphoribosylformylglycinamidine synthase [Chitinophagales bacterium]
MILFFKGQYQDFYAVQTQIKLSEQDIEKLQWLFGEATALNTTNIVADKGYFVGPRATMVSPWSTNAVEITQNMAIKGIQRIEKYDLITDSSFVFDPMLMQKFTQIDQNIFEVNITAEPIKDIEDIATYNKQEGLALSNEEVAYLEQLSEKLGRKLTDSEVFGFSQVNSEHCRHKIFNGTFVIDGVEQPKSLFQMIKETSKQHPNSIVSAYKDNVAFVEGPSVKQFAPLCAHKADFYTEKDFDSIISLKAETHNFPTTVEPFNGAATGSGGEIRDRLAGGTGSLPLAGTAVYMTSYSRTQKQPWEQKVTAREWLYQSPLDILIKASNGASDFGNKFGQPLIAGSLLTFENEEHNSITAYDKVIMLAGGIGYGKKQYAQKKTPKAGDRIVILGGDNYRIGMGGAAVSSADTGAFGSGIELNAIQRSNPEMQKRAANAIRAMVESNENTIVSIHDHGAGGHLNCLSELVEDTGGIIDLDKLPIGDPTLSAKEIIGNESQERMGLVIAKENFNELKEIADRERAPIYDVGEVTDNHRFTFESFTKGFKPMDLSLADMFGSSPKTVLEDKKQDKTYTELSYSVGEIEKYIEQILQLEAVACKDWLTNKVDRCVGGKVAKQQCVGALQLPLNNVGVMALDFKGKEGVATSIGHSPISGLINPQAGSRNSIGEALSNLVWASLERGLDSVSLSANWMWPCNNEGENARLYEAVEACADFAIELGINIPTGKDSLSMKQKYTDREVLSPGTVIISSVGHCKDITKVVEPVFQVTEDKIYYINLSADSYKLGGSSFAQIRSGIGNDAPNVKDAKTLKTAFNTIQKLIEQNLITAGHDVGSGGLITTLLEMCFAENNLGAKINLTSLGEKDIVKTLFAENIAIVFQAKKEVEKILTAAGVNFSVIGEVVKSNVLEITHFEDDLVLEISKLRDVWYKQSYLFDREQSGEKKAKERFENYKKQALKYVFPKQFTGVLEQYNGKRPKAAIIREKGSNSEREMAHAMFLAGFDVKDIHMTDLISGRENLEDVQFIGAVGGFSNSDVLGSAKGWAGSFKYNKKAKQALDNFFNREDTLSVGICNGCQLFIELGLINKEHTEKPKMLHNDSHKHESAFTSVQIKENKSVMLSTLAGSTLGVWISHGEGKFALPKQEKAYNIVAKYGYENYPANPNGSDYNTAMMCDNTGRHLVMMPHIERSIFQWNWANYPKGRKDEVSPWLEAFVNAREWILNR